MFKNYLKIALRNIIRHKVFSIINILGLAVGITICFLIANYIFHELSYDRFHDKYENLYRVFIKGEISGQPLEYAVSMVPLSIALNNEFPDVEYAVGIGQPLSKTVVKYGEKQFFESQIYQATEHFFEVFSFDLIKGDPSSVLSAPSSLVLTRSMADKYFGDEDPIGKTLVFDNSDDYFVTGICEDLPTNTHLNFSGIVSINMPQEDLPIYWGSFSFYNYVRLKENVDPVQFSEKIRTLPMEKMGIDSETTGMTFHLYLEQVKDIHLYSELSYNLGNDGSITYVYVFSAIALFILLIAFINFINLTTANYTLRAREIGIRKISGANRRKVIFQFLSESIMITILAAILAFGLIELLLPFFNSFIGKELGLFFLSDWTLMLFSLLAIILLGIVSGFYPAIYLSRLNPVSIMKGNLTSGHKKYILRNILVVFQFVISITLIASTLIIYKQLQYYQHKKLGFDKEHVLLIPIRGAEIRDQMDIFTDNIGKIPGVIIVSRSDNFPSSGGCPGHGFFPEGFSEEKPWLFKTMGVDHNFFETFGIKLRDGRAFTPEFSTDASNIIINETLAREVGWEDPIGMFIKDPFNDRDTVYAERKILGVVEDFHINSLSSKIEPLILYYNPEVSRFLSIKVESGSAFKVLDRVEKEWKTINPEIPFDYFFLDDRFDNIHRSERQLGRLFIYFTILAIFIASLGLYGLSSYVIQRRIKEIGIRKVMGSSLGRIVMLLSMDFNKWVLLANLIAWPLAYFMMEEWLRNFAYRTRISLELFILSGIIAILISFLTVLFQTVKAANMNPVDSLKCE